MSNLIRRDPLQELSEAIDRLFESGSSRPWRILQMGSEMPSMPIEVSEADDAVLVKASLPGVKPEDIDISVQDDMVTIRAESREETEDQSNNFTHREISYGAMQRTIPLPAAVDGDRAEATFQNGVLRIRLGKSEEKKAKRIQVQGTESKMSIPETNAPD